MNPSKSLPTRISRKKIYSDDWLELNTDKVLFPSGKIINNYHVIDFKGESVVVLLLNSNNEICFIKSPRYTTQKLEWELLSGVINKSESIINAGKREVLEETGYHIKNAQHAYSFFPSNAISKQKSHILLARLDESIPQTDYDHDEVYAIFWLNSNRAKKLILQKKIIDGYALITLLYYFNLLEK